MIKKYKILAILLFVQIIVFYLLSNFSTTIEKYYSNGLYLYISTFLRSVFGWVSFSVGDIIYSILILLTFIFLYKVTQSKNRKQRIIKFLAGFSVFYFCFYFFWGINYARQPLTKTLVLQKNAYKIGQLLSFTDYIIDKTKNIQIQITGNDTIAVKIPYSTTQILNLTQKGYSKLSLELPQFQYKPVSLKKSLFSLPLTYMGFSGYFNPLTGEAQVDILIPKITLPITCSHEVAHQLGIASESEANFIGYLAANAHDDLYFQYAANLFALRYALSDVYRYDPKIYKEHLTNLPKGIQKNIQELKNFWKKYDNPVEPLFKTFYDSYLKINHQKDGLKSYSKMIDLLISYHNKYK